MIRVIAQFALIVAVIVGLAIWGMWRGRKERIQYDMSWEEWMSRYGS